jgi:4-amino-4-deoxy-L-arabinose transferase-like glycosyltransferase
MNCEDPSRVTRHSGSNHSRLKEAACSGWSILRLFLAMKQAELADHSEQARVEQSPDIDAWRWGAIGVLALTAILSFARLGVRALWASEFRWAEISREMILNHNYFWPTINGHVYYDKPLGSYWLVVGATYLTGGMNEAASRLPCAIAGLIAVGLTILLVRDLYDLRTGVISAAILATCFSFVFFSRHASADVETITGELAALWLFWRNQERGGGWWTIALWVIMALTSLTKGLLGFVLPILVIGGYASIRDGWATIGAELLRGPSVQRFRAAIVRHRWVFNWWTVAAIAIAVTIYYVPFAISYAETGKAKGFAMVYRENVTRYFEPFDHVGPIYLYIYVIFGLMAPWSVFLLAALVNAHRRPPRGRAEAHSDRFVLVFFWITFVFFTLSGSRRSYYLLPILPAAAILVARLLVRRLSELDNLSRTLMKLGFAALAIIVGVSTLAFFPPRLFLPKPYALLPDAPHRIVFAIVWIASIIGLGFAARRISSGRILIATVIAAWSFLFYFFVFAMPAGDAWRGEKQFAQEVRSLIDDQADILAFYNNGGPVYYLNLPHPVPTFATQRALDTAVNAGKVRWVVVRQRDLDRLGFPAEIKAHEAIYPWDSNNHVLNSMVLVRVKAANG